MPTKLRKLKITRVAVCQQGANYDTDTGEGAHILLFKAMDEEEKKRRSGVGATPQPDERDLEPDEDEDGDGVGKAIEGWGERITKKADYDALSDSAKLQLFYDLIDGGSLCL